MRILIWNINGIRAISKKNVQGDLTFENYLESENLDIICFNETKICEDKMRSVNILNNYLYQYHSTSNIKKGYSGVSIYSKIMPTAVHLYPNDIEGRVVCLEFNTFILIAVYQPNSGSKLARLNYRVTEWAIEFKKFILSMKNKNKEVMIVGDMNVARSELDVKNASKHTQTAGYTKEEKESFESLLSECQLIDTWRNHNPDKVEYTYFDYRSKARDRNAGWRIDYFLCTSELNKKIQDVIIQSNVYGSDHLPIICTM